MNLLKKIIFLILIIIIFLMLKFYSRSSDVKISTQKNNGLIEIIKDEEVKRALSENQKEFLHSNDKPIEKENIIPADKILAVKPDIIQNLEQYREKNINAKVKIETLKANEMLPDTTQNLDSFKKENPNVEIKIKKLENKEMFPADN